MSGFLWVSGFLDSDELVGVWFPAGARPLTDDRHAPAHAYSGRSGFRTPIFLGLSDLQGF